jgi:hypothetical protein
MAKKTVTQTSATKKSAVKKTAKRIGGKLAVALAKSALKRIAKGAGLATAANTKKTVDQRIAALQTLPPAVYNTAEALDAMMKILAATDEPVKLRLAALESLGAAAFSSAAFPGARADYIATLRKVATDADPELRRRALGILSREKDGYAQTKLLQGLQDPSKALVSPEKALQLLGNNVHSDAYTVARTIAGNPPNPAARREALRLLAADAASAPMFETILRDKSEPTDVRQLSASALHAINPDKLRQRAREILMDTTDNDDIHETCLAALTHFGGATIAADNALVSRISSMSGPAKAGVQKSARQFLDKYGR